MAKGFLSSLRRWASLRQHARKGVAAVEMALIAPVFFTMLIGVTEMSLVLTAQQLIENACFNASRLGKTGFTTSGSTQLATVMNVLNTELESFGTLIDTSRIQVTSQVYANFSGIDGNGANGLGSAGNIVVYTVSYPWEVFTPLIGGIIGDANGNVNITARIVVRNEPYG